MKFLSNEDYRRIRIIALTLIIIGLFCFILGLFWREYIVYLSGIFGYGLIAGGISMLFAAFFGKKYEVKAKERLKKLGIDVDEYS